ncbi:MAG: OmpA family protein [Myxococcales bacterium]|nr:OmpA family protein [Myxococcales bacterium]MCB9749756.1 OmpA family protein [Myxococcales bacterium]
MRDQAPPPSNASPSSSRRLLPACVLLALAAPALTGCVTKKKYTALEQQLNDTAAALAKEQDKSQSLEQALGDEKRHVEQLDEQIAGLEQKLQDAEAQLRGLEEDLAKTIKDRSALKESIDEMKRALAVAKLQRRLADARIASYKNLLGRFQSMIDSGKLQVKIVNGRMVLVLRSDILFASGSVKISDEGKAAIVELSQILAEMKGRNFQVEGHTDNQPIKTQRFPSNWELAAARAIAVANVMIEAGLSSAAVSAASYGENMPTASNDTDEGRAQNRRIEIVLVPDLSDLPGFEELNKLGSSSS